MKNKKIIIICSILIFIISIIIIYIKTDFLKTKEQLFWKYMWKEKDEIVDILSNNTIEKYSEQFEESSYIKEGNISITSKNHFVKPIKIQINEKGNNQKENINTDISITYNKKNIGNISIIKDDNYYLLKSEEIDDKYIGFENDNLKQLAKKLGIENVDFIPNKIKEIDYYELFSMTDKEKRHIISKYMPIFRQYVKNKNYDKEKNIELKEENCEVDKYILNISEEEFNKLLIDVLKTLYEDEITLEFLYNKVKVIDDTNKFCDVENIKVGINELIKYLEEKEAEEKIFLSIIVYKNENNVIKTELVLKNNRTISIISNKEENKIIIQQYNVENSESELDISSIGRIVNTLINSISEISYTRYIENNKTNNVEFNIICSLGIEEIEVKYSYVEEIKNNVENIMDKNDVEFIDINRAVDDTYKNIIEKIFDTVGEKI